MPVVSWPDGEEVGVGSCESDEPVPRGVGVTVAAAPPGAEVEDGVGVTTTDEELDVAVGEAIELEVGVATVETEELPVPTLKLSVLPPAVTLYSP